MMDNVLVFGATQEEHDNNLKRVFHTIQESGMTLNPEKCEFSSNQVKFLGHQIDERGISPDPDKFQGIVKKARPQGVSELRRFLGMVNQMTKFSPHLADVTWPLRELLECDSVWHWGQQQGRWGLPSVKREHDREYGGQNFQNNLNKWCQVQTQTAEPLQSSPLPELPFQKVGTDLFQWNTCWSLTTIHAI